jgi:hypothetical protein
VKYNRDYIIQKKFPHSILMISSDGTIGPAIKRTTQSGPKPYLKVKLNGRSVPLHVLIAAQWIPNWDPWKCIVDHINSDCADYRVESLRWVTPKVNLGNRNTNKGEAVVTLKSLPEGSKRIVSYNDSNFSDPEFKCPLGPS